jgi:short-subunit dehydrogenase
MAHAFADEGANVTITDIKQERADQVVSEVQSGGVRAAAYIVDHASEDENKKFAEQVLTDQGHVDVLCANAGVGEGSLLEIADMEDWRWVMGVNFWGAVYALRYLVPSMIERGSGSVLITASGAALLPGPGMSIYHASKAAACSLGESLNIELAPQGINVSVLCPGIIRTAIASESRMHFGTEEADKLAAEKGVEMYASDRAVEPAVVAADALNGLRKRKLIIPSPRSHVLLPWLLHRLSPGLFGRLFVLPKWRKGETISGISVLSR